MIQHIIEVSPLIHGKANCEVVVVVVVVVFHFSELSFSRFHTGTVFTVFFKRLQTLLPT
jgi:hypothetical protein